MNQKSALIYFPKNLFWDVQTPDLNKHREFIISRVLEEGFPEDVKQLFQIYTEADIQNVLLHRKDISIRTGYFWCAYFDIPIEKCRCLTQ